MESIKASNQHKIISPALRRCFSYENALSAVPQLPGGEVLAALAEIVSSSPADEPWHMRLRNVLQNMCVLLQRDLCEATSDVGSLMLLRSEAGSPIDSHTPRASC